MISSMQRLTKMKRVWEAAVQLVVEVSFLFVAQ